jgi:hypothetical protein
MRDWLKEIRENLNTSQLKIAHNIGISQIILATLKMEIVGHRPRLLSGLPRKCISTNTALTGQSFMRTRRLDDGKEYGRWAQSNCQSKSTPFNRRGIHPLRRRTNESRVRQAISRHLKKSRQNA